MQFLLKSNQNYLTAQRIYAKNKAVFNKSYWSLTYKNLDNEKRNPIKQRYRYGIR